MSTDVEEQLAALAVSWERDAAPVTADEIAAATVIGRAAPGASTFSARPGSHAPDVPVVDIGRPRRRPRRVIAVAVGTAAALVAVLVAVSQRGEDTVEPVSPEPTETAPPLTVPDSLPAASPAASTDTSAPAPTTTELELTVGLSPAERRAAEFAPKLAEIDAAQSEALRAFTTIGFTVQRIRTFPDGSPAQVGFGTPEAPARVVLRNDGSAAVSGSTTTSYYDATTGTARGVFVDAAGHTSYQQIDGQSDSSVALGVPTGLPNGVVTPMSRFTSHVESIVEEDLDGRPTWRIDQAMNLPGVPPAEMSTWIDQSTGITLRTRSVGMASSDGVPITDDITLSEIEPGAPLPDDFPNPFPPDAQIAVSGDPTAYSATTLEAGLAELGPGIVVPTLAPDQIAIWRMNFGTDDGGIEVSPSLIMRWFDGFERTELRIVRYPSSMTMPDTCVDCGLTLLEEIRAMPVDSPESAVVRDGVSVWITGSAEKAREVVASLVMSP